MVHHEILFEKFSPTDLLGHFYLFSMLLVCTSYLVHLLGVTKYLSVRTILPLGSAYFSRAKASLSSQ